MLDVTLYILLAVEVVLRLLLEIRERRATQLKGGAFLVLRLIPLVNDIVPLPETLREPAEDAFTKEHERGHVDARHSVLRNLVKVVAVMLAVGFFMFMIGRCGTPLVVAVLWLHLAAAPCRLLFHWYCWGQEYEADAYAYRQLGRQKTKEAMRALAASEIPYTPLFALVYREHPTAALRRGKLLGK